MRLFSNRIRQTADRFPSLARSSASRCRASRSSAHFLVHTSVSGATSLVFAQAEAQRSVASIAQNRAPYGSLRAFLQHRLPAAPVAPQANQHSSKPAAPALQAHASARVLASISGADWAHPARVAGRCTTAVDQVGRSRRRGRRGKGSSSQLSSHGKRSSSILAG